MISELLRAGCAWSHATRRDRFDPRRYRRRRPGCHFHCFEHGLQGVHHCRQPRKASVLAEALPSGKFYPTLISEEELFKFLHSLLRPTLPTPETPPSSSTSCLPLEAEVSTWSSTLWPRKNCRLRFAAWPTELDSSRLESSISPTTTLLVSLPDNSTKI
jgi:hypothetical protein